MSAQTKYLLEESRMPTHWYNIVADLPCRSRRRCIRIE
jgi:predicted alternative tryptophan synthase beta-subunit